MSYEFYPGLNWTFFFNPPPLKLGKFDQKYATYGENDLKVHILAMAMLSMGKPVIFDNFQQKSSYIW